MNDPFPILCGLERKLTPAEKKALILFVGMSNRPAQDLAGPLAIADEQMEQWHGEARRMYADAVLRPSTRPALGVVA